MLNGSPHIFDHSTTVDQASGIRHVLDIGCWMNDVGCFDVGCFDVGLLKHHTSHERTLSYDK